MTYKSLAKDVFSHRIYIGTSDEKLFGIVAISAVFPVQNVFYLRLMNVYGSSGQRSTSIGP